MDFLKKAVVFIVVLTTLAIAFYASMIGLLRFAQSIICQNDSC